MKNSVSTVKTRFAPSPTGFMHFGNVRAALFNYLFSKKNQGIFLLRIEDTDVARSEGQFRDSILQDLAWLGLSFEEGPYYQSERQPIYDGYYDVLAQKGFTYPCFCTEAQLAITRKVQLSQGQPPRYPGTCRNLTEHEIEIKKAQGIPHTLRFKVPKNDVILFEDLVKGPQKFDTDHIGDFIIRRHDNTAPFMYCNAIDDSLMGITHALRGDDHLTNTPRQIMILAALELPIPQYGHFPTILGPDGRPLSKRNGSRSIRELREEGYLPEGIVNYLARLGHYDPDLQLLSLPDLASHFELDHISKSPAHFDPQQLRFWQKEAMHQATFEVVWPLISHYVSDWVPQTEAHAFWETVKPNLVMPEDALYWAKIFYGEEILYQDKVLATLKEAGPEFYQTALKLFEQNQDAEQLLIDLQAATQKKGKALFMPIRAALTATLHGPELPKIVQLLGPKKVTHRFLEAIHHA